MQRFRSPSQVHRWRVCEMVAVHPGGTVTRRKRLFVSAATEQHVAGSACRVFKSQIAQASAVTYKFPERD